ncbi:MAG: acetyl-CoA C-acyltransferase [Acidobacteria bacterium]|nr:MAG: acetyl-CoA C-acyltransferase [Acidobacteriota bacterium]
MRDVVVAGAVRTPIGRFGGALAAVTPAQLGAAAAREALSRAGIAPARVDDVLFGCARQAGGGPNVARQVAWRAGIPQEVPAATINMACASSLKAIDLAFRAVRDGDAQVVVAGGVESMSRVPYLLTGARWGMRMGDQPLVDAMYQDGFLCPLSEMVMGETAERLAEQYRIGREEQDAFALRSQQRAGRAQSEGRFDAEIVAVHVPGQKGDEVVSRDEHLRPDTTAATLAKQAPVFKADGGTVTAGNSSGITDGAAAMVVLSAERAAELGAKPMARMVGLASAGVDPHVMGIGVVPAVRRLLEKTSRRLEEFDVVEVNEAFAAQVIACDRELRFDAERLNVNGGAIALGHPIGATGARLVVSLLHEMARRRARRGLATLCVSGGMGMAAAFDAT